MRTSLALAFSVLVAPALANEPAPPAQELPGQITQAELVAALQQIPALPVFSKSVSAFEVVNAETGELIHAHGDDRLLLPASTMKLVTAAVALRTLGPAYRFPTWIKYDGTLAADAVLDGNLYVVGQGDPTMVVERMWRMVADIRSHGVMEIKGDIIFDDSYTVDSVWVPGWNKAEDLEEGPTYFSALGALSLNYNIASIHVRPGAAVGDLAVASFDTPSEVIALDNQLTTGRKGSKYWAKVERSIDEKNTELATYKVTGNIPLDQAPDTYYRTLVSPTGNYIGVFKDLAKAAGIKVKGKFRRGVAPASSVLLVKSESERLTEILTDMNKQSNNFMAEQVLRAVGAEKLGLPGTTEKGAQVMRDYLAEIGVPSDRYKMVNGSGLSREGVLTPSALDAVLVDMHKNRDLGPEFLTTLAVGGRDGTLYYRFRADGLQGRVRAKTGSLAGVFCLSGYVLAADDQTYAFSFFVNELEGGTTRARYAHDQLVLALAGVTGTLAEAGDGTTE